MREPRGLVRPAGRRAAAGRSCEAGSTASGRRRWSRRGEGSHRTTACRRSPSSPTGRRRAADRQRSAADRAGRGVGRGVQPRREARSAGEFCARRTGTHCRATAGCCSSSTGSSTWRARSSASGASARAAGSRCSSAATSRTRCSCRSRRRRPRCLRSSPARASYANHGQRVVAGQRLMQAASDIFLGWRRSTGSMGERDFYVRQLKDWKGSVERRGELTPEGMASTAACADGRSRAPTPARVTGSPSPPTSAAATRSTSAIAEFAEAYADQNERDYAALTDAVASGRLTAETDL